MGSCWGCGGRAGQRDLPHIVCFLMTFPFSFGEGLFWEDEGQTVTFHSPHPSLPSETKGAKVTSWICNETKVVWEIVVVGVSQEEVERREEDVEEKIIPNLFCCRRRRLFGVGVGVSSGR